MWQADVRRNGQPATDEATVRAAVTALGRPDAQIEAEDAEAGIWLLGIDPVADLTPGYITGDPSWTDGEFEIEIPLP